MKFCGNLAICLVRKVLLLVPINDFLMSESTRDVAIPRWPYGLDYDYEGSRQIRIGSDADIRNFAPVARIMKTALPDNAKIAKEAKECMQECVSEFISFITSEGQSRLSSPLLPPWILMCLSQLRRNVNRRSERLSMGKISCLR